MKYILQLILIIFLVSLIGCTKTALVKIELGEEGMEAVKVYASLDKCRLYTGGEKAELAKAIEKEIKVSYGKYKELVDSGHKVYASRSRACDTVREYETPLVRKMIQEAKAQRTKQELDSVRAEILALKSAGHGNVLACNAAVRNKWKKSRLKIGYSNTDGSELLTLGAVDEHGVNIVRMKLDKKRAAELLDMIKRAYDKAQENSDISDLKLDFFTTDEESISLSANRGTLNLFFSTS